MAPEHYFLFFNISIILGIIPKKEVLQMGNTLHEAGSDTVDTIVQIAKGLSNVATNKVANKSEYSYSSIANAASKLIAVFPVLTSRTVSFDTARMTSKYIEQISCQFFMFALQQANISNAKDGITYLRQFHQNLNMGDDNTDAVIAAMQSWIDAYTKGTQESTTFADALNNEVLSEAMVDPFMMQSDDVKISASDMRELMHVMQESANIQFYDTKLNPLSIDDYVVREFAGGDYRVTVSPYILNEAKANKRKANNSYNENKEQHRHEEEMNKILNDRMKTYQKAQSERDKQDAENEKQQKEDQKSTSRDNDWRDANRMHNNTAFLKDQDIKKMNDALPSILIVKFYQKNNNDGVSGVATEFLIGIKSKVVPITTAEILRRIMNDNKDGQKFLKFMRVITGELKASDVLLGLSRITDDVKSYKVKGARGDIWTLLQNRAVAAKEQVRSGKHNDFSAITTVLISQQDADELYREENFDINDPKNAIHFMQSYNLMGFAIADDSNEVLHLLLDNGSKNFEDISYRMLERETQDSTYKKLINLMAASK
jgi:hypothetical protein|nr:MAG TPA: hypothetical protein [Caudoviricetes sp.]